MKFFRKIMLLCAFVAGMGAAASLWAAEGQPAAETQPAQPATVRTAPNALTDTLVRRPANIKVNPKAKTMGHGVDAGTSISLGRLETCSIGSTV